MNCTKNKPLIALLLSFGMICCQYFIMEAQGQNKPNIILIISDDHGTDALGSYGNHVIKTPHLDDLAREGTRFTQAFCTSASCSPSRSVILTGLHNHQNGMYGLEHSYHHFSSFDQVKSLPVILAENNYRTARVGKFHIAPENVFNFQEVLSKGAANDPESLGRSPVKMAELCQEYIQDRSGKPFFLLYASDDPHRSNIYLPDGKISFNTYPQPNSFGNKEEGYPGVKEVRYSPEEVLVPPFLPDTEESRQELAEYYQSVSRLDQGIGKLIEILKQAGKYENTLIIYLSDNGVAFPGAKTTLYDPGIRLPCLVKAPHQNKAGLVQDGLISWTDITPTILDYAQAPVNPKDFYGRSFKELVETANVSGWDEVYSAHALHEITMYYPMRMVRDRKYKLIYNIAHPLPFPFALDLQQSPTWISTENSPYFGKRKKKDFVSRPKYELYDLENDPDELHNLAEHKGYGDILQSMIRKIKNFQKKTNDPWSHKWDYE
jgi:N-sulfoglucosamine sulfohydrolase